MTSTPKVSKGLSTYVGFGVGLLGVVNSVVTALTASQAQLNGPGKWSAILGVALIGVTALGRQLQASAIHLRIPSQVMETLEDLPTLAQELESPPPLAPTAEQRVPAPGVPVHEPEPTAIRPDGYTA